VGPSTRHRRHWTSRRFSCAVLVDAYRALAIWEENVYAWSLLPRCCTVLNCRSMFLHDRTIRWVLIVSAFLAAFGQAPLRASETIVNPFSTFMFTGDCLDCTGQGHGTLVVQNYTLGNPFDITNFVSFSYISNLTSFMLTGTGPGAGQVSDFSGSLPAMLPSFADVNMNSQSLQIFNSSSGGSWCAGFNGCNLDFGTNGIWDNQATSSVPEPTSLALTVAGFVGLVLRGLRRAKSCTAGRS
jgi:hypothetical protein